MIDVLLFEMLVISSLLVSGWQILFRADQPIEVHLVFGAILLVSLAAARWGRIRKRWLWLIAGLSLLMPVIQQGTLRWSIPVFMLLIWRYLVDLPTPRDEADYADKLLVLFFGMAFFVILRDNTSYFVGDVAPLPSYLPVFFLSGIFFLRSLRHRRTGQSQARIRRRNLGYLSLIALTYALSQFSAVRNVIRDVGYDVLAIILWPIIRLSELIVRWWFSGELPAEMVEQSTSTEPPPGLGESGAVEGVLEDISFTGSILGNVLMGILLVILIVFIYQVFLKRLHFSRPVEQSDDIREQLGDVEPKRRRARREQFPVDATDQIRYYYRRLLERLGARITPSNTTAEIDAIAQSEFARKTEQLSEIYREVRYGGRQADRAMVEEMKQQWKHLSEKK